MMVYGNFILVVEVFGEILKKGLRLWGSHISHISELNPVIMFQKKPTSYT